MAPVGRKSPLVLPLFLPRRGAQRRRLSLALTKAPLIVVPAMRIGYDAGAKHDEGADAEGSDDEVDAAHEALPVPAGLSEPTPQRTNAAGAGGVADRRSRVCKARAMRAGRGFSSSEEHDARGEPSEARRDHQSPKEEVIVFFVEEWRPAVHHATANGTVFASFRAAAALTCFTH